MNAADFLKKTSPYCVLEFKRFSADDIKKAGAATQRVIEINAADCANENALFKKLAQAFSFPAWFGHNLDALYDCLSDLPEFTQHGDSNGAGYLVLLQNLPLWNHDTERREAFLDVFRDAADDFAERQAAPFRVFYSWA